MISLGEPLLPHPTQKLSKPHPLGFYWKLYYVDRLKWCNFQLLSYPWRLRVWDWKLQLTTDVVVSPSNLPSPLNVVQKSPHWHNISCGSKGILKNTKISLSYHLAHYKDFRSSVPATWTEIKYTFLLLLIKQQWKKPPLLSPIGSSSCIFELWEKEHH